MRTWGNVTATLSIAVATFGLAGPTPGSAAAATPVVVARYTFDGGTGVADDSGHTLTAWAGQGGRVRLEQRRSGRAAEFPAKCAGKKCPHAVLDRPGLTAPRGDRPGAARPGAAPPALTGPRRAE